MSTIPADVSLIATAPTAEQPVRRLPRLVGWSVTAVAAAALWVGLFELVRLAF